MPERRRYDRIYHSIASTSDATLLHPQNKAPMMVREIITYTDSTAGTAAKAIYKVTIDTGNTSGKFLTHSLTADDGDEVLRWEGFMVIPPDLRLVVRADDHGSGVTALKALVSYYEIF